MFFLQYISVLLSGCGPTPSQSEEIAPTSQTNPPVVPQDNDPIPVVGSLPVSGDKEVWIETLFHEGSTPHRISGTRSLVHQAGEALFIDEAADTTISLGLPKAKTRQTCKHL